MRSNLPTALVTTLCATVLATSCSGEEDVALPREDAAVDVGEGGDGGGGGGGGYVYEPCIPDCTGKLCGDNGCGGNCGTCPAGSECGYGWICHATCTPACAGKQCGGDGCGGACGTCPSGSTCSPTGQCVQDSACGTITYTGVCEGNNLKYCDNGELKEIACQTKCGWDPYANYNDCMGCNQFYPCLNEELAKPGYTEQKNACLKFVTLKDSVLLCNAKYPCGKGEGDAAYDAQLCDTYAALSYQCMPQGNLQPRPKCQ